MRTLDALVAEKVMGWTWNDISAWSPTGSRWDINGDWLPHYSTDIAKAFEAETKIGETEDRRRSYTFALCELLDVEDATIYYDATDWMTFDAYWMMIHATAEQRCIAMLLAVGVSQDEIDAAMKQGVSA